MSEQPRKYTIALSPLLGIDPTEFMDEWNRTEACASVAAADTEQERGLPLDPQTFSQMVVILEGIFTGVASNFVYDLVRQVINKHQARVVPRAEPLPDGSVLLEVLPQADR